MNTSPVRLITPWEKKGGIWYAEIAVTSMTGPEWKTYLKEKGIPIYESEECILDSAEFTRCQQERIKVAILCGSLFDEENRRTADVLEFAYESLLQAPCTELACCIRDLLTNESMADLGLWVLVTMHDPIQNHEGVPSYLTSLRYELDGDRHGGSRVLSTPPAKPGCEWIRGTGFVFIE